VAHVMPNRGTDGLGTSQGLSSHCMSNGHKTYPVGETLPACIFQFDTSVDGEAEPR
jgi:hypothetical protein